MQPFDIILFGRDIKSEQKTDPPRLSRFGPVYLGAKLKSGVEANDLIVFIAAFPGVYNLRIFEYIVKPLKKRNNIAEIERAVVKCYTYREHLARFNALIAEAVCYNHRLILNGTYAERRNLRRYYFK